MLSEFGFIGLRNYWIIELDNFLPKLLDAINISPAATVVFLIKSLRDSI